MRDLREDSLFCLQERVRQKIEKINTDPIESKGLTKKEVDIAIKLDLIDKDQSYFWTEEWQAGEREAKRNIKEGDYEIFENVDDLLDFFSKIKIRKIS